MEAVRNSCFSSVFIAPLESDVLLKKNKNRYAYNHIRVTNNSFKSNRIYCKLPEGGIEENPTSMRPSNFRNKMEEYNIAMKRMMRNPYEYHHDLGKSLLNQIWSHSHNFHIFYCNLEIGVCVEMVRIRNFFKLIFLGIFADVIYYLYGKIYLW